VTAAADPELPLARLMAMAYRQLITDLHAKLADRGYTDVRSAYGFVLLAVRSAPTTGADVAELLGMTKQAASKLIDAMELGGYVERQPHGEDARAKAIAITARGRKFLATAEGIYRELEADWAGIIGEKRLETMRRDLRLVVEASHGGVLPPVRPTG
jgi:DNA-binding MarR family transcriptional regulator